MAQLQDKQPGLLRSIDWLTILIYLGLLTFGWLSVCGASYSYGENDLFSLSARSGMQIVWIGTSLALALVLLLLDDRLYDTFSYVIFALLVLLLFATIFNPHSIKGSRSWLVLGPLRLQPAEFAKFATALALAKFMGTYGYDIHRVRDFVKTLAIIFVPMLCIVMQRETGSALVYLAFFLMLYREGMTGSVLFTGAAMVLFFVVGIRYAQPMLFNTHTAIGPFVVMLLIQIFTSVMIGLYCRRWDECLRWLDICLGVTTLCLLFAVFVIPFNLYWVQLSLSIMLACYLLWGFIRTRLRNYLWVMFFAVGSVAFFSMADYALNNVLEPHQRTRINVLLGLEEDLRGAGYNVHQSEIAIGSGGLMGKGFLNGRGFLGCCGCAVVVLGADIAAHLFGRATTDGLWAHLWLLCAVGVLIPCVYQCGHGAGIDTGHWYPVAILLLWRLFAMGLYYSAFHLPPHRCRTI